MASAQTQTTRESGAAGEKGEKIYLSYGTILLLVVGFVFSSFNTPKISVVRLFVLLGADQILLRLTMIIENISNIYIFK